MRVRTLIIDDECSARSRLRKLLGDFPELEIVDEVGDGLDAVDKIERVSPDLIFLDVQMPGLGGFEVLRALDQERRVPLVIFVTAYDEYALSAFQNNAIGYLLKPINRLHLQRAVQRASALLSNQPEYDRERARILDAVQRSNQPLFQIPARKRDHIMLLSLDDIYWFKIEDGLVRVKTDEYLYWTNYLISELEARLPGEMFFRADRATIVNLRKVREIVPFFKNTYTLLMKDQDASEIRVSERRSKKLRELLR